MLEIGIIFSSVLFWSFLVVLVKKLDGIMRFCIDYRRLNKIIRKDSYLLFRIFEVFDVLGGARYFLIFDLRLGYW